MDALFERVAGLADTPYVTGTLFGERHLVWLTIAFVILRQVKAAAEA